MPPSRVRAAAICCVLGGLLTKDAVPAMAAAAAPWPPQYELRGEAELMRVYDLILDAQFGEVGPALDRACGPAPPEACDVLAATAIWWQIQLDPDSHERDPQFANAVERAIARTDAWTERDPLDAEAWFYLGAAYGARVQWRVLRGERLAAARDGARIKQALERALELEPGFDDAYFGLGMYRYYAAVAPAAARILRFLLMLPGGNREEGLEQMRRARARGRLLQGEADYQLHVIDLWYEEDVAGALTRLQDLRARYPRNPHFPMRIAHVRETYEHDVMASLDEWRQLLAAAEARRVSEPALAEGRARLAIARLLDWLHRTDEAIAHLEAVVAAKPAAPHGSVALAHLRLGAAHDRLGARTAAIRAYKAALAATPTPDPHDVGRQATAGLRRAPDARAADAFRLSLEGLRLLERHDLPRAAAALERSLTLAPQDPVARYRFGRVLQARGDAAAALAELEVAIREAHACPAPILGEVHLDAGRLHERLGRRDDAIAAYRIASTLFGAGADTRAAAARALARMTGGQEVRSGRRGTGDQEIRRDRREQEIRRSGGTGGNRRSGDQEIRRSHLRVRIAA